ncbi:MAG: F0F1 ATP synthase subunit B' [Rhodospirillales bacterium]|nr:F0F1 ATP synthase subunit B' [Rhodospirillales bacterium]
MPQLDVATFPSQLFWLAVSFAVLYVILATLVMPRVGTVLDERQRRIDDSLDRAAQLKSEAEAAVAAYEEALAEARAKAHDTLRDAQARLQAETDGKLKALAERLGDEVKAAEARIAQARDQALQGVRALAAETAGQLARKLAGADIDAAKLDQAVGRALGGS